MAHSDFVAVHRSTSADASLSQQVRVLQLFVSTTRGATQKTSICRCRSMQNDGLNASLLATINYGCQCMICELLRYSL